MFGEKEKKRSLKGLWGSSGKILLAALLVAAVGVTPFFLGDGVVAHAETSLSDLKKKQAEIEKKQRDTQAELERLKNDKAKKQEYKETLDEQMATIQEKIHTSQQQITQLDQNIREKETAIAGKQTEIDGTFEQLKQRIRALYMMGDPSTLEMLLNADDVVDFRENAEVVQQISDHDAALMDTLKQQLGSIADEKKEIETNRKEVAQVKKQQEADQNKIEGLLQESKVVLDELGAQEKQAEQTSKELENEKEKAAQEIEAWYQEYYRKQAEERKRREEERKRQEEENKKNQGSQNTNSSNERPSGSGAFLWPAPGTTKITSPFGSRWGTTHRGVDISGAGAYGKPIVASRSGTVIRTVKSGWGMGWGHHVMIDHGDEFATLYAHCSTVVVNEGDTVQQGQVIAYIGNTGDSYGAHLHFEVWKNGTRVNPMPYL